MTHQMMPPPGGATTRVSGRAYTAASGTAITVQDSDVTALEANGWIDVATGGANTTANRPINPPKNTMFHDQTLGYNVIWDGRTWRNPATGAAV